MKLSGHGARLIIASVVATNVATAFANDAHEQLRKLPAATRTHALATTATSAGFACAGASSEYKGMDKDRRAYWRVDCSNGQSYMVSIDDDKAGSTKVVSCALMRKVGADTCFVKWKK
ncbi:MAG TPA: hypothetical protein VGX21_18445 [Methylomirabilota bacterium]|jgi:hypothetical protein|nr:hypothetical protein [Methylomirabilota bacterium]